MELVSSFRAARMEGWSVEQVGEWVESQEGFGEYGQAFRSEEVDGATLLGLSDGDLKAELGMGKLGVRRKLLRAVAAYQSQGGGGGEGKGKEEEGRERGKGKEEEGVEVEVGGTIATLPGLHDLGANVEELVGGEGEVRVLYVGVSGVESPMGGVARERDLVEKAVGSEWGGKRVVFESMLDVSLAAMEDKVAAFRPHVVHLVANHVAVPGKKKTRFRVAMMKGGKGLDSRLVSDGDVADALDCSSVLMVVLNVPHSGALARKIPASLVLYAHGSNRALDVDKALYLGVSAGNAISLASVVEAAHLQGALARLSLIQRGRLRPSIGSASPSVPEGGQEKVGFKEEEGGKKKKANAFSFVAPVRRDASSPFAEADGGGDGDGVLNTSTSSANTSASAANTSASAANTSASAFTFSMPPSTKRGGEADQDASASSPRQQASASSPRQQASSPRQQASASAFTFSMPPSSGGGTPPPPPSEQLESSSSSSSGSGSGSGSGSEEYEYESDSSDSEDSSLGDIAPPPPQKQVRTVPTAEDRIALLDRILAQGETTSSTSGMGHKVKRKFVSLAAHDELMQLAADGDYYALFGVSTESPQSLILTQRRELTRMLHPDNFDDADMQAIATAVLSKINLAFQNVLKSEKSRALYNELCELRLYYPWFGTRNCPSATAASVRDGLQRLYAGMKSTNMPASLISEAQLGVQILNEFIIQWNENKKARAKAKAKAQAQASVGGRGKGKGKSKRRR